MSGHITVRWSLLLALFLLGCGQPNPATSRVERPGPTGSRPRPPVRENKPAAKHAATETKPATKENKATAEVPGYQLRLPPHAVMWLGTPHARYTEVTSLDISSDGRTLATGAGDGAIRLWALPARKLQRTLWGHRAQVFGLCISPDGRRLASSTGEEKDKDSLRIWDTATWATRRQVRVDFLHALAWIPDSKRLLVGAGGKLQLLDVGSGKLTPAHTARRQIAETLLTPDGKQLVVVLYGKVRVLNLATGKIEHTLDTHGESISDAVLSADGRFLAVAIDPRVDGPDETDEKAVLQVGDLKAGQWRANLSLDLWKAKIALSPDGKTLLVNDDEAILVLRVDLTRAAQKRLTRTQTLKGHRAKVTRLAFAPSGRSFVSADAHGVLRFWDLAPPAGKGGSPTFTLGAQRQTWDRTRAGHEAAVTGLAFSKDGKTLLSRGKQVRGWDLETGRSKQAPGRMPDLVQTISCKDLKRDQLYRRLLPRRAQKVVGLGCTCGDDCPADPVAWLSAQRKIAALLLQDNEQVEAMGREVDEGYPVDIWTTGRRGKLVTTINMQQMQGMQTISPDGKLVATTTLDALRVWEVKRGAKDGKPRCELKREQGIQDMTRAAFSDSGALIAAAFYDDVEVWRTDTCKHVRTLKVGAIPTARDLGVKALAFSRDDARLATGHEDGTILLWKLDK